MQQVNENRVHPQHLELYNPERIATTSLSQRERVLRVVADERRRLFRGLEEARARHLFYRATGALNAATDVSNGGTIVQRFSSS